MFMINGEFSCKYMLVASTTSNVRQDEEAEEKLN